jgi:enoyl-CoA hydratase/carnithine racemase
VRDRFGFKTIRLLRRGRVAWLILNRPEELNAYNVAMRDEMCEALAAVGELAGVGALVLAGAGPAFSTGGDLTEFGRAPSPVAARWIRFRRDVWGLLRALAIPTVAAVHGYAVGGGLEMVLLCDLAVAAKEARFCFPETGRGMIPGVCGTQTAPRRLGLGWALDLSLTGRWIDAETALSIGLVAEVAPLRRLRAAAGDLARELSRLPGLQVRAAKTAVREGLDLPLSQALRLERRLAAALEGFARRAPG